MNLFEEAKKIVNNVPEEESWVVIDLGKAFLIVDEITDTPTNLIMKDGTDRKFKIIPDLESKKDE